jgi:hypothetical protein
MSMGNVKANSHGLGHSFLRRVEVFTDIDMDGDNDLQKLLEEDRPYTRQSPSPPPRDQAEVDYSPEDLGEVFTTDATYDATFFEHPGQLDNEAQAENKAQANVQNIRTEDVNNRVQAQEKAQANDQIILTENGDNRAQAQANPAMIQTPLAEGERPILTQQKVMDLIMQQQALPNNTSGSLMAATWATKKQGSTDMLSGFRSPTGTTYRVALNLASVLFVSVAAADANRMSLMAQNETQQKLVAQAEKHRETLEKEFTINLERIREEDQKTFEQTVRIREELIRSCQPINNAGMLEKIEGNQGAEIVKYQLKFMQARAERLEQELQSNKERRESDMLKVLEDNK